ncbi:MAG: sulfurtransferase TusA family protein [Proteobacteria bacterium]|nr:sulfurtransferase TusA family protein [Pseudomonadota bacterium]
MEKVIRELDARGLRCPLPILKTKKALAEMNPGEQLRVMATDPGSVEDFATFSANTGHALLASQAKDGEFIFLVQKKV